MRKKISLLLAMVLAMTMVMGIGVTAFAEDNPYAGTIWVLDHVTVEGVTYRVGQETGGVLVTEDLCRFNFKTNTTVGWILFMEGPDEDDFEYYPLPNGVHVDIYDVPLENGMLVYTSISGAVFYLKKQEITIPFGTVVDTSLDWYGPAKMAELYGMN